MNLPPEGIDGYLSELAELNASDIELLIAPPFPYLGHVYAMLASLGLRASVCAQNCSDHEAGAFTGEVSASMLRGVGTSYVLVGHSERRTRYGEGDATIGRKLRTAAGAGLRPILCIGEDVETRRRGGTNALLARQLGTSLDGFSPLQSLLVAYEPVWAIGTGQNATPGMASEAHGFIRQQVASLGFAEATVLYGGSVMPENAAELAAEEQIDGFLVGGASLEAAKFRGIYQGMLNTAVR